MVGHTSAVNAVAVGRAGAVTMSAAIWVRRVGTWQVAMTAAGADAKPPASRRVTGGPASGSAGPLAWRQERAGHGRCG
jgi:hypothetical protein